MTAVPRDCVYVLRMSWVRTKRYRFDCGSPTRHVQGPERGQGQSGTTAEEGRCSSREWSAVASFQPRTSACAARSRSKRSRVQLKSHARANHDALLVRPPRGRPRSAARERGRREGQRAAPETIGERRPFDQFEHQRAGTICFLQPIDRADVRVIECRQRPRFACEARAPLGISREVRRQELDRDIAAKLAVARAIDLAHAARAERRHDSVGAELTVQHRGSTRRTGDDGCRTFEELRRNRFVGEQGLDFPPQGVIALTRLGQEGVTFGRGFLQGQVVDVGERAVSPVRLHEPRIPVASAGGAKG